MRETNRGSITGVGISSLMVIFAVLCLTVFTLLTVSSAQAEGRLSDRAAASVLGYYRADLEAEQTLAQLRAGEKPTHVQQKNGIFYYEQPISDTQLLVVEVMVEGGEYHILRWQAVSTAGWQVDDRLPVWSGETEEGS